MLDKKEKHHPLVKPFEKDTAYHVTKTAFQISLNHIKCMYTTFFFNAPIIHDSIH